MTIIEKNVENNRQILRQLQKSLIANSKRFEKMRKNAIKIMNAMHVTKWFMNAMHCMKCWLHLNDFKKIESINVVSKTFDSKNSKRNQISINVVLKTFDSKNSRNSKHLIESKSNVTFIKWKILVLKSTIVFECAMHTIRIHIALREKTTYNDESTFSLLNFVRDLIAQNQFVVEICRKLIISKTKTNHWQYKNEFLYYDDVVYISKNLRENVIRANHDNSFINHFDIERTLKLIRRKYY